MEWRKPCAEQWRVWLFIRCGPRVKPPLRNQTRDTRQIHFSLKKDVKQMHIHLKWYQKGAVFKYLLLFNL